MTQTMLFTRAAPKLEASRAKSVERSLQGHGVLQRKCACGGSSGSGGECEEKKDAGTLQRKSSNGPPQSGNFAPPIVHDVLTSPGQPLDGATRAFFEPRFGHDFGRVRVHTNERAAESAKAVNALAYTVGSHIAFASERYTPDTPSGRNLLAHELTHTIQQPRMAVVPRRLELDPPRDAMEREAEGASKACEEERSAPTIAPGATRLSRQQAQPKQEDAEEKKKQEELQRQLRTLTQGPQISPSAETQEDLEKQKKQQEAFQRAGSAEKGGTPPGAIKTWGWGGAETDNIYQQCSLEPMDRETFRAFLKTLPFGPRRDKPKDMDDVLGVTSYNPGDAVPPQIAAVPVQDGNRTVYKLKGTHAEMPPIKSAFTRVDNEPKEFIEGSLPFINQKCNAYWKLLHTPPPVKYDIVWKLPDDGAQKVREEEEEHCKDIRYAFDITLGLFASSLNNIAAAEREYTTEKQAVDDAVKRLGVKPEQMLPAFARAAIKTRDRDDQKWHTTQCVTKNHCQEPDPEKNKCRGYVRLLDAASMPEVGHHSSQDVIK